MQLNMVLFRILYTYIFAVNTFFLTVVVSSPKPNLTSRTLQPVL